MQPSPPAHRASHWPSTQTCRPPRPGSPTLEPAKSRCIALYSKISMIDIAYTADYTAKNRCIALYTDTRCLTAFHSYTAIQRYTALYSAIHYTAIQRYTVYIYTALYTIQPLRKTPLGENDPGAPAERLPALFANPPPPPSKQGAGGDDGLRRKRSRNATSLVVLYI
jgi:hypothetical protein